MEYRVTFSGKRKSMHIDVSADSMDNASKIGRRYADDGGLYYKGYDNMSVEEIPQGISNIGIEFEYKNYVFKQNSKEYMVIRAESEAQARDYYNKHFKGKRFAYKVGEVDENGKSEYGRVCETYFACCPGFHADATKDGC